MVLKPNKWDETYLRIGEQLWQETWLISIMRQKQIFRDRLNDEESIC
jgi:hypothetical protein